MQSNLKKQKKHVFEFFDLFGVIIVDKKKKVKEFFYVNAFFDFLFWDFF